jgi:hypothetical protein
VVVGFPSPLGVEEAAEAEVRVQVQGGLRELEVRVRVEEAVVRRGDKVVQTRFYHG